MYVLANKSSRLAYGLFIVKDKNSSQD